MPIFIVGIIESAPLDYSKRMERTKQKSMENDITATPLNKMLCPFIRQPFENCYCTSTSSLYTEATIHYCGGNYVECQIYDRNIATSEVREK